MGEGIYCYDILKQELLNYSTKNGLVNDNVLSITGVEQNIWVGTLGGVSSLDFSGDLSDRYSSPVITNYDSVPELGHNYIYTLFIDSRKRLWLCSDGNGLSVYSDGKFSQPGKSQEWRKKSVYAIGEDGFGNIWYITANQKLYRPDHHICFSAHV